MVRRISKLMPYTSLIREHEKLVRVLSKSNHREVQRILQEQKEELREYKEEYEMKKKKKKRRKTIKWRW